MNYRVRTAGFTLVELLIAIAVVGVLAVVIYRLFDVTSQNFREVDQLAELNDRLRFATENVRRHVQAAGAQSSPDSDLDAWVAPPLTTGRVAGLLPYGGWQNDTSELLPVVRAANPNVSFDGIVIIGAFDFPLSFEFAGMGGPGANRVGRIYNNSRGVQKLAQQDIFADGLLEDAALSNERAQRIRGSNWATRLIRVTYRQGFQQFLRPTDLTYNGGDDFLSVALPALGTAFAPQFKSSADGFFGLDDLPEGDVGYDAALLDAYWIHVVPDASNPRVMNLVRDRLCAATVATLNGPGWDPEDALASTCGGGIPDEQVIIASYVADFQIWFDCADTANDQPGGVRGTPWQLGWRPNDHATDCMAQGAAEPGLVRAGHIRLSLHTRSERTDQRHIQFEDALGAICNPDSPGACDPEDPRIASATLRTYDFYPESEGATQVVVMQSDFEVVNFMNRNAIPAATP